jgi:hypothetical protein
MTIYNLRLGFINNNEFIDEHIILDKLKTELSQINWKKYENMTNTKIKLMGDMYYSVGNSSDFSEKDLYTKTKCFITDFVLRITDIEYIIQFYIFRHLDI